MVVVKHVPKVGPETKTAIEISFFQIYTLYLDDEIVFIKRTGTNERTRVLYRHLSLASTSQISKA